MGEAATDGRPHGRDRVCVEERVERGTGVHRRTIHAATRAGQRLEEDGTSALFGRRRAGKQPAQIVEPRNGDEADLVRPIADRIVHAAFDGIEAPLLRGAEFKFGLLLDEFGQHALLLQQLPQHGEDKRKGELVWVCVRLVLLRSAGAEEDDLDVSAVFLLEELAVRPHGRR